MLGNTEKQKFNIIFNMRNNIHNNLNVTFNCKVAGTIFIDLELSHSICGEISGISGLNFPDPKPEDGAFA